MEQRATLVALVWSVALAVAFAGVVAVAARRRDGRAGVGAVVVGALIVGAVAFPAAVLVATTARLDGFGIFNVVWWTLVLGLPLASVLVLVQRPTRGVAALAAVVLVVPAALGVWGILIEPGRLETKTVTVPIDRVRVGADPVRVGVLSDIQFRHVGPHERAAVARMAAERPDVVLIAGDVFQGPEEGFAEELPAIRELLAGLEAPHGVFLVGGDVDQPVDRLPQMVEGTGVTYLQNEVAEVVVGDRTLRIGGVELAYDSPAAQAVVDELAGAPGDEVRLLLAHRPDVVLGLAPRTRIDLVVAGHTHGGQIEVPGLGPIATASQVPRAVAAGGLSELDGRRIFVTTGVGMERGQAPPVRLGVNPTVAVVTLSSA